MTDTDSESTKAAAHLHRLAQATALERMFEQDQGRKAHSVEELSEWWVSTGRSGPIIPTAEDAEKVNSEHPDLVLLANRSNPFLSGRN